MPDVINGVPIEWAENEWRIWVKPNGESRKIYKKVQRHFTKNEIEKIKKYLSETKIRGVKMILAFILLGINLPLRSPVLMRLESDQVRVLDSGYCVIEIGSTHYVMPKDASEALRAWLEHRGPKTKYLWKFNVKERRYQERLLYGIEGAKDRMPPSVKTGLENRLKAVAIAIGSADWKIGKDTLRLTYFEYQSRVAKWVVDDGYLV